MMKMTSQGEGHTDAFIYKRLVGLNHKQSHRAGIVACLLNVVVCGKQ